MDEQMDTFVAAAERNAERVTGLLGKLTRVAEPGAVFSEPITAHDHTVITASEVTVGVGLGFGTGGGSDGSRAQEGASEGARGSEGSGAGGSGGGGGGGGGSMGRPVAVISIGPGGVRVEPVTDTTKIALAFFTMFGAMFMSWRAMRRFGRP